MEESGIVFIDEIDKIVNASTIEVLMPLRKACQRDSCR